MWNADDLSKETKKEILQYRIKVFENLAQDSVTLASMQIVAVSLLINQFSGIIKHVDEINGFRSLIRFLAESRLAVISGLLISIAIITSIFSYYVARKKATELPNSLIYLEYSIPEGYSDDQESDSYGPIADLVGKGVSRYRSEMTKIRSEPVKNSIPEFNDSASTEHHIRSRLTISLILTFSSILLFFLSLINKDFPFSDEFAILLLIISIQVYLFLWFFNHILALVEKLRQIGRRYLEQGTEIVFDPDENPMTRFIATHPGLSVYFVGGYILYDLDYLIGILPLLFLALVEIGYEMVEKMRTTLI